MDNGRFVARVAARVGFLFLCAVTGSAQTPNGALATAPTPHMVSPAVRATRVPTPEEDFAGLTYTDEERAKIDKIHEDMKSRMDLVVKDDKADESQKNAMLDGLRRMERHQVYMVLAPDQQAIVRKNALARHAAEREQEKKQAAPAPK